MAFMAITGATPSNAAQAIPAAKAASAQTGSRADAPAVLKPDTVKLSAAAQAKMMHRAGQSPALIAATLGTNVAAVDGYLNIKVATQAAAIPTPAAQNQPASTPAPVEPTEQAKHGTPAPSGTPALPAMTGRD